MDDEWVNILTVNPLPQLLGRDDPALAYFSRRDLVEQTVEPIETLWESEPVARLIKKQGADGAWRYPGKSAAGESVAETPGENYSLLETYRNLRILVEMYGLSRGHPTLGRAAEYVFSCQTGEGDIRGILGNQYMPYYHGAMLELLIKAGYADDERVIQGLEWLLTVQQADGGWIVPAQALPARQKTAEFWISSPPRLPDRERPFSHLATGMALRAFAAHPDYRQDSEVRRAAECLKSRLFKPDKYKDRQAPSYWIKFQYPFWWTTLITALDTLYWLDYARDDPQIASGLDWFLQNQAADGLWQTGYGSGKRAEENRRWVGLAVCRVLKYYERRSKG